MDRQLRTGHWSASGCSKTIMECWVKHWNSQSNLGWCTDLSWYNTKWYISHINLRPYCTTFFTVFCLCVISVRWLHLKRHNFLFLLIQWHCCFQTLYEAWSWNCYLPKYVSWKSGNLNQPPNLRCSQGACFAHWKTEIGSILQAPGDFQPFVTAYQGPIELFCFAFLI